MTSDLYERGLGHTVANHQPLTPLSLLSRAAHAHPERLAVVHGESRCTYRALYERCRRLAAALSRRGIGVGDTVAVMAPNVPAMLEAHYGVPMAGAVLNALNIRLDAATIAFILEHAEAKLLITDREFSPVIGDALARLARRPIVIDIDDPLARGGARLGEADYEAFLAGGTPDFAWQAPADEWQAIALNYTSGTTGNPKGVVYHHRGAFLNALGNALAWGMTGRPVYLWTLPMFHCNGWCFPWTLSALAGTHVCLRRVEAPAVFRAIAEHGVTHFCGAPVVLNMLTNAAAELRADLRSGVEVMTAGAAPPPAIIAAMEAMGFRVTHVYGLTETYGPAVVCDWHPEWDDEPPEGRARRKARQGVRYPVLEGLGVFDPASLQPVPADGRTMGEVMMRGNIVMKGYLKNRAATEEAFRGGWFHSGDLGVVYSDGYLELRDRSKDIIISGGENISTIEVEGVLYQHPAVLEAAVVAKPDAHWGEVPCAFVALKEDAGAVEGQALIAFCREHLAHFKAPRYVVFGALPKTSTGKIQKYVLRQRAAKV
ncbi:MAG: acyl-CoA synthetase [Alphaproteobacteria bacterium]|nr:acyl-CoA synthetase [Alphaproteobacteria bacterium]